MIACSFVTNVKHGHLTVPDVYLRVCSGPHITKPMLLPSQVARRKGPDGKLLSMGYGFVETDSEAVAQTVIKQLQVRWCGVSDSSASNLSKAAPLSVQQPQATASASYCATAWLS